MSDATITPTLAKAVQEAAAGFLASRHEFSGVTIVARRKHTLISDINAAVAQLGVCIFVMPGLPNRMNPNLEGPHADRYELRVRVIEDPAINQTLPDAFEIAELVLRALHNQKFPSVPNCGMFCVGDGPNPEPIEDGTRVIFDAVFLAEANFASPMQ